MRWPWVSRATLKARVGESLDREDRLRVMLGEEREYWRGRMEHVSREYGVLLERYHALRFAGANPAAPAPDPQAKAQPDPVTQAMIARGAGNRALMKHYATYVTEERAKGTTEATIAANILAGETMDDGGVPG